VYLNNTLIKMVYGDVLMSNHSVSSQLFSQKDVQPRSLSRN
jgi:hypothetical protein